MNDVELYRSPSVDSWTGVLTEVGDLAGKIASTDFVPDSMKGKPAAVAACILAGREMGIGPMAALQGIHVIKGKPGLSANLMRQLILQAGHDLRYVETTDTRCVVEGRRRNTEDWQRVSFTADQARKAKIDLGAYPEDKLVARATSRLARRVFADCLGGMPYLADEAAEGATDVTPSTVTVEAGPAKRTAKRAGAVSAPAEAVTRSEVAPAPVTEPDAPPLPGDDDPSITRAQLTALAASLGDFDVTDREDRLQVVAALAGRPGIESSKDLTKGDASVVMDALADLRMVEDPPAALRELVATLGRVDADTGEIVDVEVVDPDEPTWPEAAKPGSRGAA